MKAEIVRYLKKVCKKYGFSAYYLPDNDTYVVHFRGRAIQNFNSQQYRELGPTYRTTMWLPLLRVGLNHNLGESYKAQMFKSQKRGKAIC